MKARYHGQWTWAQRPTEYTYIYSTVSGSVFIEVPKGERWLLRAWSVIDTTEGASAAWAAISILHKDTQELIPLSYSEGQYNGIDNAPFRLGKDDINPIILESLDRIYIFHAQPGEWIYKFSIWYEALEAKDKEPEKEVEEEER